MEKDAQTVPLTAVLFAYNQAAVVEAAVQSIFCQTVAPAEIILSDDGSIDETYAVLERMAAAYRGPSHLIVRRSTSNAGWFAHVNCCMAEATHDYVIVFAGDDVSKPHRIESFWRKIQSEPGVRLIWSAMERMHPDGSLSGQVMGIDKYGLKRLRGVGASQCWHKDLFRMFGDLPPVQAAEDIVLPFRALLLNGLHYIPEPLVNWRDRDFREMDRAQLDHYYSLRASDFRKNAAAVMLTDLETRAKAGGLDAARVERLRGQLLRLQCSALAEYQLIREESSLKRLALFCQLLPSLGWKAGRRMFHNQILGLPSFLESAYPRALVKIGPPLFGVLVFAAIFVLAEGVDSLMWALPVAMCVGLLAVEVTRLVLRWLVRIRWRSAADE